jgi:hypothetical protein
LGREASAGLGLHADGHGAAVSGEKNPAPFIVYVECCYEDWEHKKPVALLRLSDNSTVRLSPGFCYCGNMAGPKLLNALQDMLVLPAAATELSAEVRATAREALKEAYK